METLLSAEARRDFYTGVIKEIKHLVQFDHAPNLNLKQAEWEIYKITFPQNFQHVMTSSASDRLLNRIGIKNPHESNHRVLFQNANGDINMGVCFHDSEQELYDIAWFCTLNLEMETAFNKNK